MHVILQNDEVSGAEIRAAAGATECMHSLVYWPGVRLAFLAAEPRDTAPLTQLRRGVSRATFKTPVACEFLGE